MKQSTAAIAAAYTVLFNLRNPAIEPKIAVVQDGRQLKAALTAALKSKLAKLAAGAKVKAVALENKPACTTETLPSPCAEVTYDIISPKGTPLLKNSKGFAVYLEHRWLVAKSTICTLLTLENGGIAPRGC